MPKYVRQDYLVENILPKNEVHLIAGPSGAGKTRLLFQELINWQQKQEFLDFKCQPFPETMYLGCDRSNASISETLSNFPDLNIRWRSIRGKGSSMAGIVDSYPEVKLFIIDGISTLVQDHNSYGSIQTFLCNTGELCTNRSITILGSLHSPKTKQNEKYLNPRQRVSGSVAWAAFTETVFVLEPLNPDKPEDTHRELFICPRNYREMRCLYEFYPDGRILPAFNPIIEDLKETYQTVLEFIETAYHKRNKTPVSRKSIVEEGERIGISPSAIDRAIDKLKKVEAIACVGYGTYSPTGRHFTSEVSAKFSG